MAKISPPLSTGIRFLPGSAVLIVRSLGVVDRHPSLVVIMEVLSSALRSLQHRCVFAVAPAWILGKSDAHLAHILNLAATRVASTLRPCTRRALLYWRSLAGTFPAQRRQFQQSRGERQTYHFSSRAHPLSPEDNTGCSLAPSPAAYLLPMLLLCSRRPPLPAAQFSRRPGGPRGTGRCDPAVCSPGGGGRPATTQVEPHPRPAGLAHCGPHPLPAQRAVGAVCPV